MTTRRYRDAFLGLLLGLLVTATTAHAVSPDVVISQVYGGGGNSGATYTNDFIELFNRGATAVTLTGWSVQYASAGGNTWQVTALSGVIEPGAYYLVQEAAGTGGTTPLPTPDAIGSIAMSATTGKVALRTTTTALTCMTGCTTETNVRDLVGYGGSASSFEGSGPAPLLSNTTAALRAGSGATDTDNNLTDFTAGAPNPRSSGGTPPVSARIHDIQGTAHISPLVGQSVSGVPGVVTAIAINGFYLQDPEPDSNPATSEAIFVFTSSAPTVVVGDAVTVAGHVAEFRPGGSGSTNLTQTEIDAPQITVVSHGNALPAPTVIGVGGRLPPTQVIDDDATGSVETSGAFEPATDGIDFYESLESMYVQVNQAVAVGPTNAFGELPVIGDGGAGAGPRTNRGGVLLRPDDTNPERIIIADGLGVAVPAVDVAATATGPITGVLSYSFGNFMLLVTARPAFSAGQLPRETTRPATQGELSIATFNVENLDPADPPEKFARLAGIIVEHLLSPDIIALEEVQDNTGPVDDGTVAADVTYQQLIAAIQAAGGPHYEFRQIDPVDLADGGEPGGNIRVGFLFNPSHGVSFFEDEAPAGDATTAVDIVRSGPHPHLSLNPGRIAPADPAWQDSRKPLAGEFKYRGKTVFVIGLHFTSKGGDQPLFGRFQPPQRPSEIQRAAQATLVHQFVAAILAADPQAYVAVVGDINDFEFSHTAEILTGADGLLLDLPATLPPAERYSYVFEGNSQVLDHILLSPAAAAPDRFDYDIVHVNAEYADQASDHDPQVVRLRLR